MTNPILSTKRGRGRPKGALNKKTIKAALNDTAFQNNPRLKKVGIQLSLTQEQVEEFGHCMADPVYFIERYVKFLTLDEGVSNVQLWDFQKEIVNTYHEERMVIVKTPRQVGKTSCTVGYILHYILFNKEKVVAVLAHKEKTAKDILSRVKLAYELLPMWLQQGIVEWNKESIVLENGCRVLSEATASGAIRGFTINLLYLDEFAHLPTNIAEDFFSSVYPTISSGKTSKIIITSTPKGLNLFYKFFMDAIKEKTDLANWNGFKAIETHWSQVPGRDQAWVDQQKKIMGPRKFAEEIEAEFLGSSNTLIEGRKLRQLVFIQPAESLFANNMVVYEKPIEGHSYVLSADPSEGLGLDYSTFSVFDVTTAPWRVMAKFRDNNTDDLLFASYIQQTATHYNGAYVIVENNNIGAMVLHHLIDDLDYDNCFFSMTTEHKELTVSQASRAKTPGLKTTKKTKTQGCLRLKTLVESDQIIITDFDMVSELSTFVLQKTKTWAAEEGFHDDMVSNLWLFAWLTAQPFFKDICDVNMRERLYAQREQQMAEYLPPAPILEGNFKKTPKLEVSDGCVWIPAEYSYEEAIDILNGKDE